MLIGSLLRSGSDGARGVLRALTGRDLLLGGNISLLCFGLFKSWLDRPWAVAFDAALVA